MANEPKLVPSNVELVERQTTLAAALVELQKELPSIGKSQTADTGSYTYDYADLTSISDKMMPLLGKHGLAFMAKPTLNGDRFVLAYSLLHGPSGEREDGEWPLGTGTPQTLGSAITYARRYVLCAITGVAPGGSDDDGAAASQSHTREEPRPKPDPLSVAREELAKVWTAKHGELDLKAVEDAFAQWSEGELFSEATPARLRSFTAVVAAEDDKPAAKEPLGIARDLAGDPEELAAERRADGGDAAKGEA